MSARAASDPLAPFHPAVRRWFRTSFDAPTRAQQLGWPAIARGESTLILAPTGSGKTLAAFLWCLNRLMFTPPPPRAQRCRVLYISPLKALAVDVERNLRAPLAGIARVASESGDPVVPPAIAIRTGDTPAAERARFRRDPADILITTPESLYLLLTSAARDALRHIDTVIVDEIHALVPTKRGAHLALSIERLAARCPRPPQRIGLSATQRPLDEVARFLGGAEVDGRAPRPGATRRRGTRAIARPSGTDPEDQIGDEFGADAGSVRYRPVTIVDAGARKPLRLRVEVPVEDMARLTSGATHADRARARVDDLDIPGGSAAPATPPSIWSAIHPRLLALIRAHTSTLIFVNSRRLAERLAGAINELAGEVLVRSHHGSLARAQRVEIEDRLKAGTLRALVATSSLELGIDMGAIDLVVQVEAPPSVASGLQRIGRAGHQIDAVSAGVIFPKYRGDLVACAAVTRAMHDGAVEATHYPRNPLDIVAQQIVATAAMDAWRVDDLHGLIRRAAPFANLSRRAFEGVLDMLSGRYPSDEFAALRPRVTWDRAAGTVQAREGAARVAIANGGTIPDRGLYGVFLAGAAPGTARVGELDEEMVFETQTGDTFVLGASTWRVEEVTHDRVLVSPAPGEPGKMPFWKGERAGRPIELGLAIGRLMHDLLHMPHAAALERLSRDHDLEATAAENLIQYLRDQMAATRAVPDASTIVVERVRDELGDWRVCVLSPRGGRIHAPWAMAAAARIREQTGMDVETLWGDDGFVVRFPDVETPPDPSLLLPDPDEVRTLVVRQLGATALFAARFRENAARALLLPKRRPGTRAPLWQQRKRAADLLAVASRFGSFPMLLETYRECLRDVFDMPALVQTLRDVRSRRLRVVTVDSDTPSPFAASLLFSYVASFLYDGDAPLAERRAQALVVDQAQLRELIGDAELRALLDADAIAAVERQLQRLDEKYRARSVDSVHDLLLGIGDLTEREISARTSTPESDPVAALVGLRRALRIRVAGETRVIAVEDAARYRDALGASLPPGVPEALLAPTRDPLGDLALRYARSHAPFPAAALAQRFGLDEESAAGLLVRLTAEGRLLEGEFLPDGHMREWTDPGVLRMIRRRSLARLRKEVEPVDQAVLGRLVASWQGLVRRRRGTDALLDVVEQLQGAPLAASILESEVLPARLDEYDPGDLDALMAAGEVLWVGIEPIGDRDGRIALFLSDHASELLPTDPAESRGAAPALSDRERAILACLDARGAMFFAPLHEEVGGGYPADTTDALWTLVWRGLVTNDTAHALRAFTRGRTTRRRRHGSRPFRSRRLAPPSAEGRWALTPRPHGDVAARRASRDVRRTRARATAWVARTAQQLLDRHGIVTRESLAAEAVPGGFAAIYPALKAMEEAGRIRRGYFVAGLGASQFALPGAVDLLRSLRDAPDEPSVIAIAATDPANPYGAALKWPAAQTGASAGRGPSRTVGATVILLDGQLAAYLARGNRQLSTWLPDVEPARAHAQRAIARSLAARARGDGDEPRGMLIEEVDGMPAASHPLAPFLVEAGLVAGARGFQARRTPPPAT